MCTDDEAKSLSVLKKAEKEEGTVIVAYGPYMN